MDTIATITISDLTDQPLIALNDINQFDKVDIGTPIVIYDGTPKPPKHHRKKLASWQCYNYVGILRGAEHSCGRYEVKTALSVNSRAVNVFGLGEHVKFATFCNKSKI